MTKLTNYLKLSSLVGGNREMGERVAVRAWTAAGILVGALMPGATAHAGTTEGWQASYGDGRVIVLPDRSAVKVCDGRVDDRVYKAVWMNDNKIDARRPFEVRAPQGGCETDSSVLGDVWVSSSVGDISTPSGMWSGRNAGRRFGRSPSLTM
ncbi:hypothetical protein [Nonomuraea sp. NPDC049646]|uniref:hypothetical protein n=1 Tax=unclassified Nonomuraea TaxID=2593643 RepID=UPI0037B04B74